MFPLKLEALLMASFGFFQGYMAPMQLGKEDNSGNFLQEYRVGGDFCGCIWGDFNITCFPGERVGAERVSTAMRDFSDFISDQGPIDFTIGRWYFYQVQQTQTLINV